MFRMTRGITGLLVVSLLAVGCAKSKFNLSGRERSTLTQVRESQLMNAKDAAMPKIMPETHYAAGRLFESQGQFGKALEQYQKAVKADPRFAKGHHRIGLVLSKVSRHEDAVQALQHAVELNPNDAQLRNNYGFELMFVLQWDQAERQLRKAIELEPNLARAHVNLAMALSKQDRFDEALQTFRDVLPEPDAYYNMGLLYRGQQRYGPAAEAFRHVLELNPKFSAARKQLRELAQHDGRGSSANDVQLAARGAQSSAGRTNQPWTESHEPDVPVTPRHIGGGPVGSIKAPRKFAIAARRPGSERARQPVIEGFTSTNRFSSDSVDASEAVEMSYLDEFPAPVVEGDLADSVALVDDEVDCIRQELETGMPGFFVDDNAVVAAIEGVPFPHGFRPSPLSGEDPVFSAKWALAPPAGSSAVTGGLSGTSTKHGRPVRLIGDQSHRVATHVAQASDHNAHHAYRVAPPVVNPQTGTAFTRATWPDAVASSNPRFNKRLELAELDKALDAVRNRLRKIENENTARTGAFAAARAKRQLAQLASASPAPRAQSKFVAPPQTLQNFSQAQLSGDGPGSLESVLSGEKTQNRNSTQRTKKSTLVNDKPPAQKPTRSRPRTDVRAPDWTPAMTSPVECGPWYMPLSISEELVLVGPPNSALARSNAWLSNFDELDSLIAIIRNEVVCEGSLKAEIAVPNWLNAEPEDECFLEPEPIMSVLPSSSLLGVCDPSLPDLEVETITVGDARISRGRSVP